MIVIFRKKIKIIILLSSITFIAANKPHPPPRSVNVALETSFLFDPKDLNQNKYFISNIQEFLGKLLSVIDPQQQHLRYRALNKRRDTGLEDQHYSERKDSMEKLENITGTGPSIKNVLEFVKNVGQTFVNLTGNKIKEAVSNFNVEVITEPNKPKYKGSIAVPDKFQAKHQHINHRKKNVKSIISDSINHWVRRNHDGVKSVMNTTVNVSNPLIKSIARRLNNYYSDHDLKILKKLLKKFKRHIENKQDTSKIVEELLNNAVFMKYGSLNETSKLALMEDLKMCSEFLMAQNVFKVLNEQLSVMSRRSLTNDEIEPEIRDIDDMTYTNLRRSIDNKLRDTIEKKELDKKKKSDTNNLVVDSVEFLKNAARNP